MAGWYNKVKNNISDIVPALVFFEKELDAAKPETYMNGNLERNSREIPGSIAWRFGQLQEVEAILEHLNIELRKIHHKHYRKYLEHYNKVLSSRDADKFAAGEQDHVDMENIINEVALVRNRYMALMKGLEAKQYQIGHITKLRAAGLEDITLS
jgi:hypothetical protein